MGGQFFAVYKDPLAVMRNLIVFIKLNTMLLIKRIVLFIDLNGDSFLRYPDRSEFTYRI